MEKTQRVALIGFMGAGKTFMGQKLAKKLSFPFLDLDDYIAQKEKKTIPEIFQLYGEQQFREIEHSHLKSLCASKQNTVLSTGGGTPCFFNNINLLNESFQTVYLERKESFLFDILREEKEKRPLISKKNDTELAQYIHETLKKRSVFYSCAKQTLGSQEFDEETLFRLISKQ